MNPMRELGKLKNMRHIPNLNSILAFLEIVSYFIINPITMITNTLVRGSQYSLPTFIKQIKIIDRSTILRLMASPYKLVVLFLRNIIIDTNPKNTPTNNNVTFPLIYSLSHLFILELSCLVSCINSCTFVTFS